MFPIKITPVIVLIMVLVFAELVFFGINRAFAQSTSPTPTSTKSPYPYSPTFPKDGDNNQRTTDKPKINPAKEPTFPDKVDGRAENVSFECENNIGPYFNYNNNSINSFCSSVATIYDLIINTVVVLRTFIQDTMIW